MYVAIRGRIDGVDDRLRAADRHHLPFDAYWDDAPQSANPARPRLPRKALEGRDANGRPGEYRGDSFAQGVTLSVLRALAKEIANPSLWRYSYARARFTDADVHAAHFGRLDSTHVDHLGCGLERHPYHRAACTISWRIQHRHVRVVHHAGHRRLADEACEEVVDGLVEHCFPRSSRLVEIDRRRR